MIRTVPAFSIPMGFGSIESQDINRRIVEDVGSPDLLYHYDKGRTGINLTQTRRGLEDEYESIKALKLLMDAELKEFMAWSGVTSTFKTTKYWANINRLPYAYHVPHVHAFNRGPFVGVYFPMSLRTFAPGEEHVTISETPNPGSLVLLDPIQAAKMGISYSQPINRLKFFGVSVCMEPKESNFVVFPSYVQHMVTPTEKENVLRISLAFDVELDQT